MSNEFVMVPKRIDAPNISTGRPDAGSIYADAFTKERARADALASILAERDALLREIEKRHWSGVDFDLPHDLVVRIKALSACAEPSAPLCTLETPCVWPDSCGHCSKEPSAPVERDELSAAVIEAVEYLDSNPLNSVGSGSAIHTRLRAALERKPS